MTKAGKANTRQRGRPTIEPSQRKRNNVTVRVRDKTKERLAAAAAQNGRSLSEEIEARLEESFLTKTAMLKRLESEFAGPHNFALAKMIAFISGEIEKATNVRWTDDRDTFEQLGNAIAAVMERIETPKTVVAPGRSREVESKSPKQRFSLGRAYALGFLDQVEQSSSDDRSDGGQVLRALRLASELSPSLRPLLERAPNIIGTRFIRGQVEVESKTKNQRK